MIKNFDDLPDTITPADYAEWRCIGINSARNRFYAKGFPRIPGFGSRLLADKRAVLMYDLNLKIDDFYKIVEKKSEKINNTNEKIDSNKEEIYEIRVKRKDL